MEETCSFASTRPANQRVPHRRAGQPHIEAIVSRSRSATTRSTLKAPRFLLETIRAKAEAHGRHKKQSGGHGQFGDCKIPYGASASRAGFEFANEVLRRNPRNFIRH